MYGRIIQTREEKIVAAVCAPNKVFAGYTVISGLDIRKFQQYLNDGAANLRWTKRKNRKDGVREASFFLFTISLRSFIITTEGSTFKGFL